ncbi:MAG: hypothetical protein HGJ94_13085 [Desulfosarcina sp.]|nr:hypothetical protein [Desulfosarcina sp.]MBC2743719.1 hypothetical protein [Desulfosarcina sp.]MBC2766628.1 hypothetical protein [Desulfosarcina sp.]
MPLSRLKPAVPKCWLFAASGVMWSAVGFMMCATGVGWLAREGIVRGAGFELAGLVLAVMAVRWGFGSIAKKNIRRLRQLPDRGCFFAFQAWKSYLIIMIMIALGIALRHLPIPKTFLAVVYTAIGGALFLGSFHYYRHLARLVRTAVRRR